MIVTMALRNTRNIYKYTNLNTAVKKSEIYSIRYFCNISKNIEKKISNLNICSNSEKSENFEKLIYDPNAISDKSTSIENPALIVSSTNSSIVTRYFKDFMQLTKFKLCVLNSIVAVSTYGLYSTELHQFIDFFLFFNGTMCIAMASQVLNQITEQHEDSQMKRTCGRPLPKKRITDKTAFKIFGGLWVTSAGLYSMTSPHAILLANFIMALYNMVYTPQKKFSNLSMHLGAIVGALPALLGNFAATGVLFEESGVLLALYVFAWQYVHFYGILYNNKEDYKKAGFKFISNDDSKIVFSYIQMLCAMALMIYCVYKLYVGKHKIIGPVNLALFSYFYIKSLIPVVKFIQNPQKFAKPIIVKSYAPFLIVLGSYLTTAYYMRKEINEKNICNNEQINYKY